MAERVYYGSLKSILSKSIFRPLQSDARESTPVKNTSAEYPHSQAIFIKRMSGGKIENLTDNDNHLEASLSPPNSECSSKASDADPVIFENHKSRIAGKLARGRPRRKGQMSKKYDRSFCLSASSDAGVDNSSSDFCEQTSTSKPEHGRRHRTKKHLGDTLDLIGTVNTRFSRAVDYSTYR